MIKLIEHKSSSYAPRTYHNASVAGLTVAIAVDFSTAGEKLTHKAAGTKYLPILLKKYLDDELVDARLLWTHMRNHKASILNIAGNGIYTLSKRGWTQQDVNQFVYDLIEPVSRHWHIEKIVSGGQTGIDLAGGVAAVALGIPLTMTFPKGFKQRHEDGIDVEHTEEEIMQQLVQGVELLKR